MDTEENNDLLLPPDAGRGGGPAFAAPARGLPDGGD
jgi:hypothetical protein